VVGDRDAVPGEQASRRWRAKAGLGQSRPWRRCSTNGDGRERERGREIREEGRKGADGRR